MKRFYFPLIILSLCLITLNIKSQVAINTDGSSPDGSAILDVKSDSLGVLIPRMSKAKRDTIVTPTTGLLIYQTDDNPGFYYFNGTGWVLIVNENHNYSIDDLTDGITNWNSVFLGSGSGISNYIGGAGEAVGVGVNALNSNSIGIGNVAVGYEAYQHSSAGYYNTAIGCYALQFGDNESENVAIGYEASMYTTRDFNDVNYGSANTVVGWTANKFNHFGRHNTIIGCKAGKGTTLHDKSGNVFLGYEAGFNEISDNKLYIENSNADSANALIYGDFADDKLTFNASVGIGTTIPSEKLEVNGAIKLGTTDSTNTGTIRWTGDDFEGYDGSTWNSFSYSGDSDWAEQNDTLFRIVGSDTLITILGNGSIGINTKSPASRLDISDSTGYDQFRIRNTYTPTGSSDSNGNTGEIAWDENYIYVKTSSGWKRAALSSW